MSLPGPVPIDTQYLDRVDGRIGVLQRREIATRQDIAHTHQQMARVKADIELEMESLRKELAELDKAAHQTASRVKHAVAQFKSVVKKGDFQRLQNRIEIWAPEKRVTRAQFKRMLADEL